MGSSIKIIGIGNALMDIVVKLPNEEVLASNNLPKGSMTLVDEATSISLNKQTATYEKVLTPGGSVANTIHGLAHLGAKAGFIGKVGEDELGNHYFNELKKIGAEPILLKSKNKTGVAMGLISEDGERTFGTHLGAAIDLIPEDLSNELFQDYKIAYIEGYLVQNHDLVRRAAQIAKVNGMKIAIDLASYNVVEDNLEFLKEIITEYIDIIFANEEEAKAFTGKEPEEAIHIFGDLCEIAVVKIGSKGSLIKRGEEEIVVGTIGNQCIDSTGAGDLYAAGFLFGLTKNYSLKSCAEIGSITAGNVITVYGARMDENNWNLIHSQIANLDLV